jgi:hypothetical protein
MRDSDTYMAILEEGEAAGQIKEARKLIKRLGRKRFGPASKAVLAKLDAITDLERLENLHDRLLDVSSWKELLVSP